MPHQNPDMNTLVHKLYMMARQHPNLRERERYQELLALAEKAQVTYEQMLTDAEKMGVPLTDLEQALFGQADEDQNDPTSPDA